MKKNYVTPDAMFIKVEADEIMAISDEDVFVDGGDLFN